MQGKSGVKDANTECPFVEEWDSEHKVLEMGGLRVRVMRPADDIGVIAAKNFKPQPQPPN